MSVSKDAYEDDQSLILFEPRYFTSGIREFLDRENEFISTRLEGVSSVLEVGCGPGHYLMKLAPKTDRILGIDISSQMVRIANERAGKWNNACAFECAAEQLSTHIDETFDAAILTWNTFGNMDQENHVEILKNIASSVNGPIYLSVYRYGDNVVKERLAYYAKLGFPVQKVNGNDVVYSVGSGTITATAFTDDYYTTVASKAGLSTTIHNISTCGKIVECSSAKSDGNDQ